MKFKIKHLELYQINTMVSWITRIFTLFISIYTVRITMDYLDSQQYALIAFFTSLSGWIAMLDFGLGTAFQNYISEKRAVSEEYEDAISKIFFMVLISFVFSTFILLLFSKGISLYLSNEYRTIGNLFFISLVMIFTLYLINILSIVNKLFYAEQQSWKINLISLGTSIFGIILFLSTKNLFNINKIVVIFLSLNLPNFLILLFISFKRVKFEYFYFDKSIFLNIFKNCKNFLLFSLLSNVILSIDYIIMIKFLEPTAITQYNLINRIFLIIFSMYNSFISVFWPVASEKIIEEKFSWINRIIYRNIALTITIIISASLFLIVLKEFVFVKMFNANGIQISSLLIIMLGVYYILRIWTDSFTMLISSVNRIDKVLIFVLGQAVITPILEIVLIKKIGVYGIVLGLICGYIFTVSWGMPREYKKIQNESKRRKHAQN